MLDKRDDAVRASADAAMEAEKHAAEAEARTAELLDEAKQEAADIVSTAKEEAAKSVEDATKIMEKGYWGRWKASQIDSQAVANILVDWTWCSGAWGIKIPQRLLGLVEDGSVGPKTIEAVNATIAKDEKKFIQQLYLAREQVIKDIIKKNTKLEVFRKGWNNRLNDMKTFNLK